MESEAPAARPRRLGRRIAAGVVIGVTAVAIGKLLTPQVPPIVDGLAGDWDRQNAELTRRVATRFPAGSDVGTMRQALRDQGFTVSTGEAKWRRSEYPCTTFVNIRWQARDGRIVSNDARIFQACP